MAASHSGHMVTEFEASFQSCLAALTNEDHFNVHDPEEIKSGVEQTLVKFLEMAKQMECFFLQKRLLLSAQKPEQVVREDINDLKLELSRKEQLIQKHYEKIQYWQSLLSNVQGPGPRPPHLQSQLQAPPPPHTQSQLQHTISSMSQPQPPPPVGMIPTSVPSPMNMMQVPGPPTMPQMSPNLPVSSTVQAMPTGSMYGPPSSQNQMVQQIPGGMGPHSGMHATGLQGPLAYLEKTTSNIGMPEPRQ